MKTKFLIVLTQTVLFFCVLLPAYAVSAGGAGHAPMLNQRPYGGISPVAPILLPQIIEEASTSSTAPSLVPFASDIVIPWTYTSMAPPQPVPVTISLPPFPSDKKCLELTADQLSNLSDIKEKITKYFESANDWKNLYEFEKNMPDCESVQLAYCQEVSKRLEGTQNAQTN